MADLTVIYKIGADISGLEKGVNRAAAASEGLLKTATRVGAALGAAFSVTAIQGAISSTLQYAGALNDMAARTNIGVEALQQLEFAAGQVGLGLDDVTTAVNQMQKRIGSGEAKKGLDAIGLSLKEIRGLKPEDQFFAIAEKIANIKDPAAQVNTAMALFGRQGATLLPLITANLASLRAEASVMSASTVNALDHIGDRMDALTAKARSGFGTALVWLAETSEYVFDVVVSGVARVAEKLNAVFAVMFAKAGMVASAIPGMGRLADTLKAQAAAFQGAATEAKGWADAAAMAATNVGKGVEPTTKLGASVAGLTDNIKQAKEPVDKAAKAWAEYLKKLDETRAATEWFMTVQNRFNAGMVTNLQDGVLPMAPALELMTQALRDQHGALEDTTQWLINLAPALTDTQKEMKALKQGTDEETISLVDLAEAFAQLAQVSGDTFGGIVQQIGQFINALDLADKAGQGMIAGLKEGGVAGMTQFATSAVSAAAALMQVTAQGNTLMRTLGGAAVGAQIGAAFGPIGSAIGAGVGATVGLLRGLFGKSKNRLLDEQATKDLQAYGAEWIKTAGGIDRAREVANAFGFDLDGILNNKSRKGFENVKTDLGTIDEKWAKLQAAMDKYGITVEQLGPKFKQLSQNDWAQQIQSDFAILTEAGMASGDALKAMSGEINAFIQRSIRMGTEVPASMAPMIQQMIDMGLLTDENGNAIKTLEDSGIKFGKTVTEAFEGVADAIDKLPERIAAALGKIPSSIPIDVPVTVRTKYDNVPNEEPVREFAKGTNGYEYFDPAGEYVKLHGWEKVTPMGADEGRGGGVAIIQLNGRTLAEVMVPEIPGAVRRYGLVG